MQKRTAKLRLPEQWGLNVAEKAAQMDYSQLSRSLAVGDDEPDRNLALELVRVTEAAAIAGGHWVGFGEKNLADGAAVDAMRSLLSTVHFNGVVVIGEGEKDEAPMLYNGEVVGDGSGPECDVAVDPIDGTRLTAMGINNALAVLAVAERGTMFDPSAVFYMEKLVTGPEAADMVDLRLPVKQNLHLIAKAKGVKINQLTVMVLDRDRHQGLIQEIRDAFAWCVSCDRPTAGVHQSVTHRSSGASSREYGRRSGRRESDRSR